MKKIVVICETEREEIEKLRNIIRMLREQSKVEIEHVNRMRKELTTKNVTVRFVNINSHDMIGLKYDIRMDKVKDVAKYIIEEDKKDEENGVSENIQ